MLKDYFEVPNKPAVKSGNILSCDFTDHETFIPQPLDYSRGTIATYVDCNGLIKMSGVSDTELVTNGNFDNGSTSWTLIGDASIGNGVCTFFDTGSNTNSQLISQIGILANKTYKLVFDVTRYVAGSIQIIFGGATAVSVNITGGVGTYTVYVVNGPSTSWLIKRNGGYPGFDFDIDNISLKQVDLNTPRIDYTTEIGKAKELQKPSLLLEPQSTNLIIYSEDLSQLTNQNLTINSNSVISPDGTMNATRVVPTTNSSQHRFTPNTTVSTSTVYTGSIFAKADGYNRIKLVENATTGGSAGFDLQNGTILTTSGVTAKIEAFPNDWYRCSITETTASTSFRFDVIVMDDSSNSTFAGDGTSGVQLYGYQLEQGSYPTSLIPTAGATVTRNQDLANNAGQLGVFNNEEGVLYAEMASLANSGVQRKLSISDGTNQKVVVLQFTNVNNQLRAFLYNGALQVNMYNVLSKALEFNKIAFKFKQDDFSLYVNGSEVATDPSGTTFSTGDLTQFNFNDGGISDPFHARIREIKVFRRALTDSELQELTNNIV